MELDGVFKALETFGVPGLTVIIFFVISLVNARAKEKGTPNMDQLSKTIAKLSEDNNKYLMEAQAERVELLKRVGQLEVSSALAKAEMLAAELRLKDIEKNHENERRQLLEKIHNLESEVQKLKSALDYSDDEKVSLVKENDKLRSRVVALENEVETLKKRIADLTTQEIHTAQHSDSPTPPVTPPQAQ